MALMTVRNLSVGYDSNPIKENINFSIGQGDYLCIVGENGSGKSTLMKTLLRLQKPLSGEIMVGDGLQAKLEHLPNEARQKFGETLSKIINEGSQGLICIIL